MLNRVKDLERFPGGKGINIATMLGVLDTEVIATGFLGRTASRFVQERLHELGITTSFVHINDETRHNYFIIDDATNTRTLLDEEGPLVEQDEVRYFIENYSRIVKRSSMVIMAGSVPKNLSSDLYCQMMEIANEIGVRTIVNTREENMMGCLKMNPFISMPDTRDVDYVLGKPLDKTMDRKRAACQILGQGGGASLLTFDYKDFICSTREGCWEIIAPEVDVRSRLKVGDAMIAGMAYKLAHEPGLKDALKWGAALSAASSTYLGGFIKHRDEVEKYLDAVIIKEV